MTMAVINSLFFYLIGVTLYVTSTVGQNVEDSKPISAALDQFSLKFLAATNDELNDKVNLALSPYTVWSMMNIIAEGAQGNTAREIENTLGISSIGSNRDKFRQLYQGFSKYLTQSSEGVSLDISNAIFTTNEQNLNPNFQRIAQNTYGVEVIPVNFKDSAASVKRINQYMEKATRGRIREFVNTGDVNDAQIFTTSALFFKGQWKTPFNKTATFRDVFYDEQNNAIGNVEMMYQIGTYPFAVILNNKANAVELPYGRGGKMSMIVIVPRRNENLSAILRSIADTPISTILDILARAEQDYVDEDVQVFLPKFSLTSDLILNAILDKMGIKDVFNEREANLLGMFPHYLYLSRVMQKATIEVDEEGTVASAATGGAFSYKSPPPKFYANKPFAFLIVDKQTQGIVFAGKISNPNGICPTCTAN